MNFKDIYQQAAKRKGGEKELESILPSMAPKERQSDRLLSLMTKGVFQSGFVWKVIEKKWPDFEEAFYGFDIKKLISMPGSEWDKYAEDTRIVRNVPKIRTVLENAYYIDDVEQSTGKPFGDFLHNWPTQNLVGLWAELKANGSRLGGMTGQYFLRRAGKDSFMLSRDVVKALQNQGLDVKDNPTSKKDLNLIQEYFNQIHEETGRPYTHLSKIMGFSYGENYDVGTILQETKRFEESPA